MSLLWLNIVCIIYFGFLNFISLYSCLYHLYSIYFFVLVCLTIG